jgi:hypothetical protein
MRKLMLEALAAWLALAAVSGQAHAVMQTGVKSVSMVASRGNGVSNSDDTGVSLFLPGEVTTPYSDGKVPASGSIRSKAEDVALLTSAPTDRSGTRTRSTTGVRTPVGGQFGVVDAPPQWNTALGSSLPGVDDFTLGRRYGAELKQRVIFNQHDVVSRGGVTANGASGQIRAIQAVRNENSVSLIPNAKVIPPGPTVPVPEPGSWATVLAGLLGVIAIARRRMSS